MVLATLIAFAAYMLKMGSEATPARLLLPYYPLLLLPVLKLPVQGKIGCAIACGGCGCCWWH